jgi:Uma2 family endonuclease
MIISTTRMKARQFLFLGEDPEGVRLELVNGEIAVSPSPVPSHSHIITTLVILIGTHVRQQRLGRLLQDVDTIIDDYNVRRPDILYFSTDRAHLIGKKAIEGPPDLCIEVLSPGSITIDRNDKFSQYQELGVLHYWIVDPEQRRIDGFSLKNGALCPSGAAQHGDIARLPPFPDLQIPLAELWQPM